MTTSAVLRNHRDLCFEIIETSAFASKKRCLSVKFTTSNLDLNENVRRLKCTPFKTLLCPNFMLLQNDPSAFASGESKFYPATLLHNKFSIGTYFSHSSMVASNSFGSLPKAAALGTTKIAFYI